MPPVDPADLARELLAASLNRQTVAVPPSARDPAFDLGSAYAVANELTRMRRAAGHRTAGVKVGFANKAVWRALKLRTLVWGQMYDDTVQYAKDGKRSLSIGRMVAPKIEPEIVFKLKRPIASADTANPSAVLDAVEWLALGFEVIDCPFPDWKFQPADFVAAFGLHAALVVGTPRSLDAASIPALVDELAHFQVRLMNDDRLVAEGSARNSLRSPALCLGELASAMAARSDAEPLASGDLVSSGTLTESQPIAAGELWRVEVDGIALDPLTVRTA
jgi:2-keto-4-pentenoate hydratase